MNQVERLKIIVNQLETTSQGFSRREENLKSLKNLYYKLDIVNKIDHFKQLFEFKAVNLAGIVLKEKEFAQIQEGKYVQIISVSFMLNEKGKSISKNSSLGYFGKADKLSIEKKNEIIEFVLRWRYEKTFQHLEGYEQFLSKLI